jgi:hypothetical protein
MTGTASRRYSTAMFWCPAAGDIGPPGGRERDRAVRRTSDAFCCVRRCLSRLAAISRQRPSGGYSRGYSTTIVSAPPHDHLAGRTAMDEHGSTYPSAPLLGVSMFVHRTISWKRMRLVGSMSLQSCQTTAGEPTGAKASSERRSDRGSGPFCSQRGSTVAHWWGLTQAHHSAGAGTVLAPSTRRTAAKIDAPKPSRSAV